MKTTRPTYPPRCVCLLLLASVIVCTSSWGEAAASAESPRPNVVFILADDLGYGDLSCYGCPDIHTPVLDKLATEGVRFTSFYANAPECTPTRTALMTGRYQQRVGGLECAIGTGNVGRYDDAIRLAENHDLGLPVSETTIVRLLKQAGYATAGFGKWHLGYEPKFGPLEHGFDHFFGPLGGWVDYYFHTEFDGVRMLYEDQQPIRCEGYLTDLITERAVEFIRHQAGKRPFFLYLPYTAPHFPIQAPGEKPSEPRNRKNLLEGTRETYALMVERLDEGIGKVLEALNDKGLRENTLVVFASDNGATELGRNAPFSGYKSGLFEGGIRQPCIVRWPGVLPEGLVTDRMAIMMDLSASIVRVAGATAPADRPFDGIDVIEHIRENRPAQARTLFFRARRGDRTWRAVRHGPLKYLSCREGDHVKEYLFDLAADPGEKNSLLDARPDAAARLKDLLATWEKDVQPQRP